MKTFEVTQKYIDKGKRHNPVTCPIGRSLKAEYPFALVSTTFITLDHGRTINYYCGENLHKLIVDFDAGKDVEPFEFYIDFDNKMAEIVS